MSDFERGHGVRIEAGQILDPDCFPQPNELVCIQVPKVFDQVSVRDCLTRCIPLKHHQDGCGCPPNVSFEGADNFDIAEVKVLSKTDSMARPGFKKLRLVVKVKYDIHLSIGDEHVTKEDEATFNLTVNEIYCPSCVAQVGIARSPDNFWDNHSKTLDVDGTLIKVEALIEVFNDAINHHGVLSFDVGAFFIVKCECVVQLLIPAYGYCPVPPEQGNVASSAQNCNTFNDRTRTPFPTKFFPDQKWNPLDRRDREID